MKDYGNAPMNKSANPEPKTSLHTNKGKSAGVPVIEKHGIKSGWFTKKMAKGDC